MWTALSPADGETTECNGARDTFSGPEGGDLMILLGLRLVEFILDYFCPVSGQWWQDKA